MKLKNTIKNSAVLVSILGLALNLNTSLVQAQKLVDVDLDNIRFTNEPLYFGVTNQNNEAAIITNPENNTTIPVDVTFDWTESPGSGVENYEIYVKLENGTVLHQDTDIPAETTSFTVTDLPLETKLNVLLLTNFEGPAYGIWVSNYITEAEVSEPTVEIINPNPTLPLDSSEITFEWKDTGLNVEKYALTIEDNKGNQLFNGPLNSKTSQEVAGIALDGKTNINVTLYYKPVDADWESKVYEYSTENKIGLISHQNGEVLNDSNITLEWEGNDASVEKYALLVTDNKEKILLSKPMESNTSQTISNIVLDGNTAINVTLYYKIENGVWHNNNYRLKTADKIHMISPQNGTTIEVSQLFKWTGENVSKYSLAIGTTPGGQDIFSAPLGQKTSQEVENIPSSNGKIYATLYYKVGEVWNSKSYAYSAPLPTIVE